MKVIRVHSFGEPAVMELEEISDLSPGPGEVLIEVKAAGVNPVDTYIRSGNYGGLPDLPFTPGWDAAGEVLAVGPEVTDFRAGDRVYTAGSVSGAYAEEAVCAEEDVHPLPDGVGFSQGAALGVPYATAYRALYQRAGATMGDTVLVHGATGGVGTACVQFARSSGMNVLGTGGTERGRRMVNQQGAAAVFDHTRDGHMEDVLEEIGGEGVDVVLEMLSNVNLNSDLEILAYGGRVIVIGSRGAVEIDPRRTMMRDADIRGMAVYLASPRDQEQIHSGIALGLKNGWLDPVIDDELPLEEAPRAHREVMEGGACGKLVLTP